MSAAGPEHAPLPATPTPESAELERRAARARNRLLGTLDALHRRRGRLEDAVHAAELGGRIALVVVATLATAVVSASTGRRRDRLLTPGPIAPSGTGRGLRLARTLLFVAAAFGGFLAAKRAQHRRSGVAHGF